MVHTITGVPVTLDSHPKFTIALGAALHAAARAAAEAGVPEEAAAAAETPPVSTQPEPGEPGPATPPPSPPTVPTESVPAMVPGVSSEAPRTTFERLRTPVGLGALAVVLVLVAFFAFGGSDPEEAASPSTPPTATTAVPSAPTSPQASTAAPTPTSPPSTEPAPTTPLATSTTVTGTTPPVAAPGYVRVTDATGTLTVEVPQTWADMDVGGLYLFDAASPHVSASPSLVGYLDTWVTPGITVAVVDLADAGSASQLVAAVALAFGYGDSCVDGGSEQYILGSLSGQARVFFDCDGSGNIIAAVAAGDGGDYLYLAVTQAATESDLEVLDHALGTVTYSGSAG
jgi:hypothetical protein